MKRVKRVKIIGKQHSVNYVPESHPALKDEETGEQLCGSIIYAQQEIYSAEGQTLEQEQDTLVHEIFHGIEHAMDIDIEETAIRRLATGWLAVIKDNPGLISYLRQKAPK